MAKKETRANRGNKHSDDSGRDAWKKHKEDYRKGEGGKYLILPPRLGERYSPEKAREGIRKERDYNEKFDESHRLSGGYAKDFTGAGERGVELGIKRAYMNWVNRKHYSDEHFKIAEKRSDDFKYPIYAPSKREMLAVIDDQIKYTREHYNSLENKKSNRKDRVIAYEKIGDLQKMRKDIVRNYDEIVQVGYHGRKRGKFLDRLADSDKFSWAEPLIVFALFAGIIGLTLLSTNITGNAIGNLNSLPSNILGAILVILGIAGAYFYFKGR